MQNKDKWKFILYLSILIPTFDYPNLLIGDITIRVSFIIYIAYLALNLKYIEFEKKSLCYFVIFVISLVPSIFVSNNLIKSFLYIFWILFNYITFYSVTFYCVYLINDIKEVLRVLLISSRLILLLGILCCIFGFTIRVSWLFYEPSYLSIFLIPYISMLFLGNIFKISVIDIILIILFIILGKSAIFLIYFLPMMFYKLLISNISIKNKLTIIFMVIFGIIIYPIFFDDINSLYINRIYESNNIFNTLLGRGGNRLPRVLQELEIIKDNYIFGVGLGVYDQYISDSKIIMKEYLNHEYLSPLGQPAINIWLEILVSSGFIPFTLSIIFTITEIYNIKYIYKVYKTIFLGILLGLLVTMSMESNYLRGYLWVFIAIYNAVILNKKNEIINNNTYPKLC